MSEIQQLLNVSPKKGDVDNKAEVIILKGIDCPDCKGIGSFSYCEGKHGSSRDDIITNDCSRCKGSGSLRAKIVIGWEIEEI
jgi:hypothetical protein